jgi:hypothetical protein
MQTIFDQAHKALGNFFKTCTGCGDGSTCPTGGGTCQDGSECGVAAATTCQDGGPVAQLQFAGNQSNPVEKLPNSVIYGWFDNKYPNGHQGYGHVVKVSVYSPGREGIGNTEALFVNNILPWIKTWQTFFLRIYELSARDGDVYVSVKRWDQDHTGVLQFPNKRTLWQYLFSMNKSNLNIQGTSGIPGVCLNTGTGYQVNVPGSVTPSYGFGLLSETIQGLNYTMTPPPGVTGVAGPVTEDQKSLSSAFMLNDRGDGQGLVDLSAASNKQEYNDCLTWADAAVDLGIESHACARYIASRDPNRVQSLSSGNGDRDYSVVFVDCGPLLKAQGNDPEDLRTP